MQNKFNFKIVTTIFIWLTIAVKPAKQKIYTKISKNNCQKTNNRDPGRICPNSTGNNTNGEKEKPENHHLIS